MIVNYTEQGWEIIMQRSHGLLAAQICAHWKKDFQPARWVETLIATAEHDDGADELAIPELNPETGGPKNFKMKAFDQDFCDRLLELALGKGRYIGLLTARHIHFLYQDDASAKNYCKALRTKEQQWHREAKSTEKEISESYGLLEFCDAFSLIICQHQVPPEGRHMEISSGPDGTMYQVSGIGENTLKVSPWPFEIPSFQVSYESRILPQLSFPTPEILREKLQTAEVVHHQLTLSAK